MQFHSLQIRELDRDLKIFSLLIIVMHTETNTNYAFLMNHVNVQKMLKFVSPNAF